MPPPPGRKSNPGQESGGGGGGIGGGGIAGIIISLLVVGGVVAFFVIKRRSRKHSTEESPEQDQPFAHLASEGIKGTLYLLSSELCLENPAILLLPYIVHAHVCVLCVVTIQEGTKDSPD